MLPDTVVRWGMQDMTTNRCGAFKGTLIYNVSRASAGVNATAGAFSSMLCNRTRLFAAAGALRAHKRPGSCLALERKRLRCTLLACGSQTSELVMAARMRRHMAWLEVAPKLPEVRLQLVLGAIPSCRQGRWRSVSIGAHSSRADGRNSSDGARGIRRPSARAGRRQRHDPAACSRLRAGASAGARPGAGVGASHSGGGVPASGRGAAGREAYASLESLEAAVAELAAGLGPADAERPLQTHGVRARCA